VLKALDKYLNCGILAHGCAKAHCPKCNHSELIAFSCKRRCLCPSCDAKRAAIFAENLCDNVLLKFAHRHGVFTVPKRIRPFFKFNRSLHQILYSAAWQSYRQLVLEKYPTGATGAVMALHTAGDLLTLHPHIHTLLLAGAVLPNGLFKPLAIDPVRLQQLFANKVLSALVKQDLLEQEAADSIKSWPHSGFNVFLGETISPSDTAQLLFTARYLKKCPVSNKRLSLAEQNGETTVHYSTYRNGAKQTRRFTPLGFIAELQQHLPDMWEQTTRYYGIYAARTRGVANKRRRSKAAVSNISEPKHKASQDWTALIKRIFELEPLVCPNCGNSMAIKAFITNPHEIQRLCDNLKIVSWRAPPPIKCSSIQQAA